MHNHQFKVPLHTTTVSSVEMVVNVGSALSMGIMRFKDKVHLW